jgi:hypothetical protein
MLGGQCADTQGDRWRVVADRYGRFVGLVRVLILTFPGAGALGIAFAIGWFAIVYGALLVGLSLRLKKHAEVKI